MKLINDEEIIQILKYLNERKFREIKMLLNLLKEDELRNKLKSLIGNLGKSNMLNKDEIEVLLKEDENNKRTI